MKLLIDANLSWRLAPKIWDVFPGSIHINRCGLPLPPDDATIWDYARRNEFIILTQDEDFMKLAAVWRFPPKVILIERGNSSTAELAAVLHQHFPKIQSFINSPEKGLLEIF